MRVFLLFVCDGHFLIYSSLAESHERSFPLPNPYVGIWPNRKLVIFVNFLINRHRMWYTYSLEISMYIYLLKCTQLYFNKTRTFPEKKIHVTLTSDIQTLSPVRNIAQGVWNFWKRLKNIMFMLFVLYLLILCFVYSDFVWNFSLLLICMSWKYHTRMLRNRIFCKLLKVFW